MNYYNLPTEIDILLSRASILRPKTTWYNLPNQFKAIVAQLSIVNQTLASAPLQAILDSVTAYYWFNTPSNAEKIKTALLLVDELT